MIEFVKKTYKLPAPTDVWLFNDEWRFRRHIQKHFLNPDEPWGRLAGDEPFFDEARKIVGDCQIWGTPEVSTTEELYSRLVPLLDGGLRFASELPLYIRCLAKVQQPAGQGTYKSSNEESISCVAPWGYVVVVTEKVVRTAYFRKSKSKSVSFLEMFHEACLFLQRRYQGPGHLDPDGGRTYTYIRTEFVSTENWGKAILPAGFRPSEPPSRSDQTWPTGLDQLFE